MEPLLLDGLQRNAETLKGGDVISDAFLWIAVYQLHTIVEKIFIQRILLLCWFLRKE